MRTASITTSLRFTERRVHLLFLYHAANAANYVTGTATI